jgi:hypothetical protein
VSIFQGRREFFRPAQIFVIHRDNVKSKDCRQSESVEEFAFSASGRALMCWFRDSSGLLPSCNVRFR